MRRTVPVAQQVYRRLFPFPVKDKDPTSWQDHVKRNLVLEIRLEVQLFYGNEPKDLTAESRFPGFDYSSPSHRVRLRRQAHHRRLFRAFDDLRLTEHEIYTLCDWEGTLIVRHRYEEQNRVKLKDTTGDEILERMERDRIRSLARDRQEREKEMAIARMEQRIEEAQAQGAREAQAMLRGECVDQAELRGGDADEHDDEGEDEDMLDDELSDEEGDIDQDELDDEEHDSAHEDHLRLPPRDTARQHINWQGAVRNMTHEQYSATRRLMSGTPRITRGNTPAASIAA